MMQIYHAGILVLLLTANVHVRTVTAYEDDCERSPTGCGWSYGSMLGFGIVAGVGAVVAAPLVLPAIGFTASGIAGGSVAASAMSAAAAANGGGVVAGGVVATLQSVGAAGLGAAGAAKVGAAAAVAAGVGSTAYCKMTEEDKSKK